MTTLRRFPAARWLVPILAVVVFVGGGSAVAAIAAAGHRAPPPPAVPQLLADVAQARIHGLSGTIVQDSNLGLPAIPGIGGGSSDLQSLVSGSHTLRVWYAGPKHLRLSLLGTFGESDIVRNGPDLWVWNSKAKSASHRVLPDQARGTGQTSGKQLRRHAGALQAMTPQGAARMLLRAVGSSTRVTTGRNTTVAGRPAWQLVLTPRSKATLVGSVRIAVDTATHVPTRLQVLPRHSHKAAFDVGYTSFDPTAPSSSVFRFNPPRGTKVTTKSGPLLGGMLQQQRMTQEMTQGATPGLQAPKVVGSGWSTVVVAQLPQPGTAARSGRANGALGGSLGGLLRELPKASGSWGSGRLLQGPLFSLLVTNSGEVAVGAVPAKQLFKALESQ